MQPIEDAWLEYKRAFLDPDGLSDEEVEIAHRSFQCGASMVWAMIQVLGGDDLGGESAELRFVDAMNSEVDDFSLQLDADLEGLMREKH